MTPEGFGDDYAPPLAALALCSSRRLTKLPRRPGGSRSAAARGWCRGRVGCLRCGIGGAAVVWPGRICASTDTRAQHQRAEPQFLLSGRNAVCGIVDPSGVPLTLRAAFAFTGGLKARRLAPKAQHHHRVILMRVRILQPARTPCIGTARTNPWVLDFPPSTRSDRSLMADPATTAAQVRLRLHRADAGHPPRPRVGVHRGRAQQARR